MCVSVCSSAVQQAPVLVAANHELKKKYLGRMIEEPLMAVSEHTPPHTAECPLCTHVFTYMYVVMQCLQRYMCFNER